MRRTCVRKSSAEAVTVASSAPMRNSSKSVARGSTVMGCAARVAAPASRATRAAAPQMAADSGESSARSDGGIGTSCRAQSPSSSAAPVIQMIPGRVGWAGLRRSRMENQRMMAAMAQTARGTTMSGVRAAGTTEPNGNGSQASHARKIVRQPRSTVVIGRCAGMCGRIVSLGVG
jgi:hypothetical protein